MLGFLLIASRLPSPRASTEVKKSSKQECSLYLSTYCKDTETFISCFHTLTYNTSFQYLSNHTMSVIACYYICYRDI